MFFRFCSAHCLRSLLLTGILIRDMSHDISVFIFICHVIMPVNAHVGPVNN